MSCSGDHLLHPAVISIGTFELIIYTRIRHIQLLHARVTIVHIHTHARAKRTGDTIMTPR